VNLCLNCSKQKKPNYFSKAVCVPPNWPDHFVHAPFSISQANFVLMSPFQSIRQLCADEPISINQATLGFCLLFIHLFHIIHCRFIHWLLYSFVHIIYYVHYLLCALFICVHYIFCALFIYAHCSCSMVLSLH
jgi:hypothetical protein